MLERCHLIDVMFVVADTVDNGICTLHDGNASKTRHVVHDNDVRSAGVNVESFIDTLFRSNVCVNGRE